MAVEAMPINLSGFDREQPRAELSDWDCRHSSLRLYCLGTHWAEQVSLKYKANYQLD